MSDSSTRRQQIAAMLAMGAWGFEELRQELQIPVALLEDDLRHLDKSAKASGQRLVVEPASCQGCGFEFRQRASKHFHPPGRCPECRSERIVGPRLRLD